MSVVTPLYGHTSQETAYNVADYPYGRLRCKIRYWLESHPKHGFRFVSQTENPKTLRWNAPKKSTYAMIAGCMYLDEKGHCHWTGLSEYSSADSCEDFMRDCPGAMTESLFAWILGKVAYYRRVVAHEASTGTSAFRINGAAQAISETQAQATKDDLAKWERAQVNSAITKAYCTTN